MFDGAWTGHDAKWNLTSNCDVTWPSPPYKSFCHKNGTKANEFTGKTRRGRIAQYSRHSTYDTTPPPPPQHKTPSGVDRKCSSSVVMLCSWRRLGRHIRLNLMNARGGRAKFLFIPLRPELAGFAMRKPYTQPPPPWQDCRKVERICECDMGWAANSWGVYEYPRVDFAPWGRGARGSRGRKQCSYFAVVTKRTRTGGSYGDCFGEIDFIYVPFGCHQQPRVQLRNRGRNWQQESSMRAKKRGAKIR